MRRVLIIGVDGFVGAHLVRQLHHALAGVEVVGLTRRTAATSIEGASVRWVDLCDRRRLQEVLEQVNPEGIFHLASDSSVALSWKHPQRVMENNTRAFLNLVESVRTLELPCRILVVGSSEQYGAAQRMPIREEDPLKPLNPYAVSKCAQEQMARLYANGLGLDVVMTRSFNHVGPGQSDCYAIASFAKQMVQRKLGHIHAPMRVGNLEVIRDFVDVRDVVKAYVALLESGKRGEVYNVCFGRGHSLKTVLELMLEISGVKVVWEVAPERLRPHDVPVVVGSREKIHTALGWEPVLSLQDSLRDVMSEWESHFEGAEGGTSAGIV